MAKIMHYRFLNTFCGFISLRRGAIITGVIFMIAATLTMMYIIFTDDELHATIIELPQMTIRIILVFNLFMIVLINSILILGVLKERKFYLIIWIVLGILLVLTWISLFVYWGIVFIIYHQYFVSASCFLLGLFLAVVYFYLWLVVYCYYLLLKEEDQKIPYQKPPKAR